MDADHSGTLAQIVRPMVREALEIGLERGDTDARTFAGLKASEATCPV
jgi:hypothetical protein